MSGAAERTTRWLAWCLLGVGLLARVAPLANRGGRLVREFPTEDGYLMLTIARNIALGRGMSTADGTMPTNGTQPLATFIWAACSSLMGGDKVAGVITVLVLELLMATAAAYAIYHLSRRILPETAGSRSQAMLAAAGWYASATVVSHSMNCLESGLYVLLVATILVIVFRPASTSKSPNYGRWARIGTLLGVAFWARNDAVLYCVAIAAVHALWGFPGAPPRVTQRMTELAVTGAIVTAIAAPWLLYNHARFGHVMPVSGQSESMDATFGGNALLVGPSLVAYAAMLLPTPNSLLKSPSVVAGSIVVMAAYAWWTWRSVRDGVSASAKRGWQLGAASTVAFACFYGLYFGAPHFMSRYFFALSPLYAVAWGASIHAGLSWLDGRWPALVPVGALALLALPTGLNLRVYRHGNQHPHFQVVSWVSSHVADEVWIGAPQSGTLGYFHDRTINLDGKVNPAALDARKSGEITRYVVDSDIAYVADWEVMAARVPLPGVLFTMADPVLRDAFEVTVDDKELNLAVLKRKAK